LATIYEGGREVCPKWLYLGFRFAHQFYIDFSNGENCGVNFSWKKFPSMVVRLTTTHARLSYPLGIGKLYAPLYCFTAYVVAYILSYEDMKEEERLLRLEEEVESGSRIHIQ